MADCKWCKKEVPDGQKFCCDTHRSRWHNARRISPEKLEQRVQEIIDQRLAGIREEVHEIRQLVNEMLKTMEVLKS